MLNLSEHAYAALADRHLADFVARCVGFLGDSGLLGGRAKAEVEQLVRSRIGEAAEAGLTSERAVVLIVALELKAGRPVLADPGFSAGLARLPAEEPVRLEWLRSEVARRADWAAAVR
jgi:hypothetical protein